MRNRELRVPRYTSAMSMLTLSIALKKSSQSERFLERPKATARRFRPHEEESLPRRAASRVSNVVERDPNSPKIARLKRDIRNR